MSATFQAYDGGATVAAVSSDPGIRPFVLTVDLGRRYRLQLLSFGLACCAVEFVAASVGSGVMQPATAPPEAGRDVEVLVVSGTVTDKIAPAVRRLYDALPEPRAVISFGACANCGGPYWDSYSVTKGVDQLVPVDLYIPGCPPRPEALLDGLRRLAETLDGPAARASSPPVTAPVHPAAPGAAVGPSDLRRALGGSA